MAPDALWRFVAESNRIENIHREPTQAELDATEHFLRLRFISVDDLCTFVAVFQLEAVLRDRAGLNVRVGDHVPPPGGPDIPRQLEAIVDSANAKQHPFDVHLAFETLHPFTDGNGRSGRMLWAWQMDRLGIPWARIGFLHSFYYQALSRSRRDGR